MLYLLPTRSPRKYRGQYPNRIHSIGGGTDKDGRRCWHIETNAGERLTVSYDRVIRDRWEATRRHVGVNWMEFVYQNTAVHTMTEAEYDVWRTQIQAQRKQRQGG